MDAEKHFRRSHPREKIQEARGQDNAKELRPSALEKRRRQKERDRKKKRKSCARAGQQGAKRRKRQELKGEPRAAEREELRTLRNSGRCGTPDAAELRTLRNSGRCGTPGPGPAEGARAGGQCEAAAGRPADPGGGRDNLERLAPALGLEAQGEAREERGADEVEKKRRRQNLRRKKAASAPRSLHWACKERPIQSRTWSAPASWGRPRAPPSPTPGPACPWPGPFPPGAAVSVLRVSRSPSESLCDAGSSLSLCGTRLLHVKGTQSCLPEL
ncbi:surfeit locus protein 6-like [Pongo abelii]|uniref:surfeit locus protein 6-like n=1 Tax=Pongo abelii TaxID=9601 RepID=UPI0030060251